jgi:uncharacterized protein YjbI with pentapeptide repeats
MIEIKNRINGEVLYTAKNASDVREAVKEAVKAGADLRYADLRYANLSYADLSYANLRYADLRYANLSYADLRYANLRYADLRYANLSYADLSYANLRYADLSYADLSYADLSYADLSYANLSSANLRSAKGLNPYAVNDLLLLQHQVGKIRAYKLVNSEGFGPYNGGIKYEIGKTYEVKNANCDSNQECGAGINLATLPWCMREWSRGQRILLAEFSSKDIAAIPIGDGKFRCRKVKIVKELDLAEIGLSA